MMAVGKNLPNFSFRISLSFFVLFAFFCGQLRFSD